MQIGNLPRVRLANLPTPLHEAKNLTEKLGGPKIFIKREDLTGLAFGGNKTRILEFVMGDALAKKADVIIAGAGWQSNWCAQVMAAARRLNLDTVILKHAIEDGYDPEEYDGNALLHFILGGEIRIFGDPWEEKFAKAKKEIIDRLKQEGRNPYDANESPCSPFGYANCILELLSQVNDLNVKVDYIVHASGSGMTQSGLVLGTKALNTGIEVIGISINPAEDKEGKIAERVNKAAELLNLNLQVSREDITVVHDYVGEGYAVINEDVIKAIELVAKTEGIFLDPVYTGKAMSGLIDMIRNGKFDKDETVVFIHTGGIAGIFPYKGPIKSILKGEKPAWLSPPWYYK